MGRKWFFEKQVSSWLSSVLCISFFGCAQQRHDHRFTKAFQPLQEINLPNKDKSVFSWVTQMEFYGYAFSTHGLLTSQKKVKENLKAVKLSSKEEVEGQFGVAS